MRGPLPGPVNVTSTRVGSTMQCIFTSNFHLRSLFKISPTSWRFPSKKIPSRSYWSLSPINCQKSYSLTAAAKRFFGQWENYSPLRSRGTEKLFPQNCQAPLNSWLRRYKMYLHSNYGKSCKARGIQVEITGVCVWVCYFQNTCA